MAERWQSSEAGRKAAGFWRDSAGVPLLGLAPTAIVQNKDNTPGAPTGTVAEVTVGGAIGFYVLTLSSPPAKDVLVRLDGGSALTATRYIALEIPVGGYVDSVDVATSTRASAASVTALGSPAQAAALSALSALVTALGSPAQASALASALSSLLAQIGTRATPADVNVTVSQAPTFGGDLSA